MSSRVDLPSGIVMDAAALKRRSMELLDVATSDPKRVAERSAAAELTLRVLLVERQPDNEIALLERARKLDPYRSDIYFLLGVARFKAGAIEASIEMFDHAALLAPKDTRVRFHRAYVLLEGAKRSHSTDLADAARDDFEAVLFVDRNNTAAALGAIEAALYGKAKRLRETLTEVFSRVLPEASLVQPMTRLLYQAIFAFGVGKAKNVDTQNKKTMDEVAQVARKWLGVSRGDSLLGGVLAATTAKCDTPEDLCAHLPNYVRDIPDVRIVRLLVRERLAEVVDPTKRLELFQSAMERIPPLDGIAQDYLQLVHLVAKRAAAEGNLGAARAAWQTCASKDPDNPSTVHNLLRVAEHEGNANEIEVLRGRLAELVGIYAEHSPRADRILARAAARFAMDYEKQSGLVTETAARDGKGPSAAILEELGTRLVRADALTRLALDESTRSRVPPHIVKQLVDPKVGSARVVEHGLQVLSEPLTTPPPIAYAYFEVGKDTPDEALAAARDKHHERWNEQIANATLGARMNDLFKRMKERADREAAPLFDPITRAEYDRSTASAELADFYQRHSEAVLDLLKVARDCGEEEVPKRVDLAGKLIRLADPIVGAYLPTTERDEAWLRRAGADVAYGAIMKKGYEAMNEGKPEIAVDLAFPYLEPGARYFRLQRLYARAILEDSRVQLVHAAALCRKHAQLAVDCAEPGDPDEVLEEVQSLAGDREDLLRQRGAAERSRNWLARGQTAAALGSLFEAHPTSPGPMPARVFPTGLAYQSLEPAGRGLYAWCVAQALRSNTIDWYNAQRPTSHWELGNQKMAALKVARTSERWASYASQALSSETLPPAFITQIRDALANLGAALERDRKNLSG